MILDPRSPLARVAIVGAAILPAVSSVVAQAPAPAPAPGLDAQDAARAAELFIQGKYAEAIPIYEGIPQKYPTSIFIPEATFRIGYIQFLLGEYDKSVEALRKVPGLRGAAPEIVELSTAMVPQVLSAKANKLPPDDPGRKAAFEDAVREFDTFLQKFPTSDEAESANLGKALAQYQLGRYEDAAKALRENLQKFSNSDTILESQYLLALTLGTLANVNAQKATARDPSVDANYDEAEKLLNDLFNKQRTDPTKADVALANDARFQIGELLLARSAFAPTPEARTALLNRALENYRFVQPKEVVLGAQRARIVFFQQRRVQALQQRDLNGAKRLQRLIEKQNEKLAGFEGRTDQTVAAKVKMGQVYMQLGRMDETRVLLDFAKDFIEDPEQKKQAEYSIAVSYAAQELKDKEASQKLSERAVEVYEAFKGKYPKDPIGENLALLIGARFIDSDPDKAIKYFEESLSEYPEGRFKVQALQQQANALVKLGRFDEAQEIFKKTAASATSKEVSSAADFGIATVLQKQNKLDEAIAAFKKVRDTYAGTTYAEQAAFWVGQLLLTKNDANGAISELQSFAKSFPKSDMMPMALFYTAQAQILANKRPDAMATYKEVGTKFPEAEVAPYSYFERVKVAMEDQKLDEVVTVMREFIKAYPDAPMLFQAYDQIAQVHASQKDITKAVETYDEYIKAKPQSEDAPEALLRIASLWRSYAEGQPGRYIALNPEQQAEWKKGVDTSIAAAERVVNEYPESPQVALALNNLLDVQKLRQTQAKLIDEAGVQSYFQDLAKKFEDKPATRSKIIFTLASYTYEKDKAKAIEQMASVYNKELKYAPSDLDLYGQALIEQGKLDEAMAVYEKLAADYPLPKGADPTKVGGETGEAQSIALFGTGKVLQEQKKIDEAKKRFDELEKNYGWSPKMMEANYGIALGLYGEKKYDDAMKRLVGVARSNTASAKLRASGMLLLAKIQEEQGNFNTAIDNYIKTARLYEGVPEIAAEGLWRGASLLERQGKGDIAREVPPPKAKAASKKAGAKDKSVAGDGSAAAQKTK